MKKLFLFSLFLPILCSCALIGRNNKNVSQDEYDAWIIYRKANQLLVRNQGMVAENMFSEAYNKFTLIDNQKGKLQSLGGLAKVYSLQGKADKKYSVLEKLRSLSNAGKHDNGEYYLALTEVYQQENKPDSILQTLEGYSYNSENENHILMLIYKLNAGMALKKNTDSEVIILEKILEQFAGKPIGELENTMLPGFGFYTLALAKLYQADLILSEKYVTRALEFDRLLSNSHGIADDYVLFGDVFRRLGKESQAYPSYIRAAEIYNLLNLEFDRQLTAIKAISTDSELSTAVKHEKLKKLYTESKYPAVKQKVLDILGHIE